MNRVFGYPIFSAVCQQHDDNKRDKDNEHADDIHHEKLLNFVAGLYHATASTNNRQKRCTAHNKVVTGFQSDLRKLTDSNFSSKPSVLWAAMLVRCQFRYRWRVPEKPVHAPTLRPIASAIYPHPARATARQQASPRHTAREGLSLPSA